MRYEQLSLRRVMSKGLNAGWQLLRIPLLTFLAILEPVVSFVLVGVALFGVLTSVFFRYIAAVPNFPFTLMMSISVGFALCLVPYYLLMRWLSRPLA